MKTTATTDQWPTWFNDQSSVFQNALPQQHCSQTYTTSHSTNPQQSTSNDTYHTTTTPHYIDSNPDHSQQQQQQHVQVDVGSSRSGWRWSTWSSALRNRNLANTSGQGTASKPPAPPTEKSVHRHWLDRYKRRTFPPSANRVLKLEQRRLMHGSGMKKKHCFGGSSNRKQQKQRDQFFHQPQRRRHSLSGILTSFVQSPAAASSHNDNSASNSGNTSGGDGGSGQSYSSSGFFRRGGLPFFSSHPSSNSSRKTTAKATPTIRSSMVLHFTDDDNADITSIPDVFYLDNNDGDADDPTGKSTRQQQNENGNWFSNWIMQHPRRKQKHSQKSTPKWLNRTSNSNGSNTKTSSTTTTSTPPPTANNIGTSDSSNDNDEKTGKLKYTGKKSLPLIRYTTLSDLSSLSSSNPSHYLIKTSATTESMTTGHQQKHQHQLLPFYHHHHDQSTTKQTPASYRFSAFWKSHSGKTGKQVIHVDEQGQAGNATLWSSWGTCHHETSGNILAGLFILGFLVCPCWWLGAVLYLVRSSHFNSDLQSVYLWTPRTFGHLNCWMSAVSLLLVGFVAALAIWYQLPTV